MPYQYINRRGEQYHLLQGKTKTGKPKYYVSRKADGVPVESVPEGFEIHENPERGLVSIRKIRPTRILAEERDHLLRWTRELAGIERPIVDIQDDSLVIYTPDTDPGRAAELVEEFIGRLSASAVERIARRAHYTAMMRFSLGDEQKRVFAVERWCFRGSIDDWFPLPGYKSLEELARQYLPHLNRESFFELM